VNVGTLERIQAHIFLLRSKNVGTLALNRCSDVCWVNGAQNSLPNAGKDHRANHVSPLSRGNDVFPRAVQPF